MHGVLSHALTKLHRMTPSQCDLANAAIGQNQQGDCFNDVVERGHFRCSIRRWSGHFPSRDLRQKAETPLSCKRTSSFHGSAHGLFAWWVGRCAFTSPTM